MGYMIAAFCVGVIIGAAWAAHRRLIEARHDRELADCATFVVRQHLDRIKEN